MQLIVSPTSPFVRKVRVLLRDTGKEDLIEEIEVATTPINTDPKAQAANPLGKIPALIRPEGISLYDSNVITRYLDQLWNLGYYPETRLFETLTLEATANGIMDAAVSATYESRLRPETQQSPDWVEAQHKKVFNALRAIEERWMSHLAGPFDMGHIATATALEYLDFRHSDRNWRGSFPALAAWHKAIAERPSLASTRPA